MAHGFAQGDHWAPEASAAAPAHNLVAAEGLACASLQGLASAVVVAPDPEELPHRAGKCGRKEVWFRVENVFHF